MWNIFVGFLGIMFSDSDVHLKYIFEIVWNRWLECNQQMSYMKAETCNNALGGNVGLNVNNMLHK